MSEDIPPKMLPFHPDSDSDSDSDDSSIDEKVDIIVGFMAVAGEKKKKKIDWRSWREEEEEDQDQVEVVEKARLVILPLQTQV